MPESPPGHLRIVPEDAGGRIAARRVELGLTYDRLAELAGMSPDYVRRLEEHRTQVSPNAVLRLARALGTTAEALLGEGTLIAYVPADERPPPVQPLGEAECRRLLAPGGIARIAFDTEAWPEVLPVVFAMAGGVVVVRTSSSGPLAAFAGGEVWFETDHLDETRCEGWTVRVTGTAARITAAEVRALRERSGERPWAGTIRDAYLRIRATSIAGRRLRTG
ncbi:MAG: helix-turn-helix domain-containing protein [Streptosporangiales bacterium]|nr:helix-turn-helix domain-containing protein [Streptosporangiales bacterium]